MILRGGSSAASAAQRGTKHEQVKMPFAGSQLHTSWCADGQRLERVRRSLTAEYLSESGVDGLFESVRAGESAASAV